MRQNTIKFNDKITVISFLLSIGVVYQHTQWNYIGGGYAEAAYKFLFFVIEACVPFFFAISGYLFFRTYCIKDVKRKLVSRVHTLLIPYILWNIGYAVFMIGLTKLGFIHNAVIGENIGNILLQIVNSEFSPLWFIKYLMIFVLTSPGIYYLLKNKYTGAVLILLCIGANTYFFYSGKMSVPLNVNANNLIMFNYQYIYYIFGAYMALNFKEFVEISNDKKKNIGIVMVLLLFVFYGIMSKVQLLNPIINHGWRLVYIGCLWFAIDILPVFKIRDWMKNSFFLYCSHLMILQCIQRVIDLLMEKSGIAGGGFSIAEFIIVPFGIIVMLLCVAEVLKKYSVGIWKVLTGGRG